MLLVHGMQDHCRSWDWFAERFVDRFHVVAPDLRGHGDSQWVRGSIYHHLDYLYDLIALVRQSEYAPLTLVGHSLGGTIAALFAGSQPQSVARLVSIEGVGLWQDDERPSLEVPQQIAEWVDNLHAMSARVPRRYPTLAAAVERMQRMNPGLSAEQAQHLTAHGTNQNEDGTYTWKFDNYTHAWGPTGVPEPQTRALWENIGAPVLILNASDGYAHRIGQGDTLRHFRDVELHDIEEAGHWTYHDQLDRVVERVATFVDRTPTAANPVAT